MKLRSFSFLFSFLSIATLMPNAHAAGTLSGQISVNVTIGGGCKVANNVSTGASNQWGSINFGSYGDLSNTINGSLLGSDGSSSLKITCNTTTTPQLTIDGGVNKTGSLRAMISGKNTIPYHLYSDASYSKEIPVGGEIDIPHDGTQQSIALYGRILPTDQDQKNPAPEGTYTDTVTATLTW